MTNYVEMYNKMSRLPGGKKIFSIALEKRSPYVSQLNPIVEELSEGYAAISMKKRKAVNNHLGVIDSNALFTLSQLVMGLSLESAIPNDKRWIPLGAEIEYVKMAQGDVYATCDCSSIEFDRDSYKISVCVNDENETLIQKSEIRVKISNKN